MASRTLRIWILIALWALLIAAAGAWLGQRTRIGSDLRLFLPDPESPAERILLEELKDGPGTRLLLVALSGTDAEKLAAVSDQLTSTLRSNTLFTRVENGSLHEDATTDQLLRYRYLLTPQTPRFDSASLHDALKDRLAELTSPAGAVAQDWLLRDLTGELQHLVDAWQGNAQPQLIDGVWFDAAGQRALMLVQTAAPGFDADQQHVALQTIQDALAGTTRDAQVHLDITGPGAFTALMEHSIRNDVTLLGTTEGIASILFLWLVLWSMRHVLLGSLTLATAGIGALAGVISLYPSVHGITLAFGFTLLGVAMDYPVHLMLHLQHDQPVGTTVRHVWPTLRLSIATTCIAYLALVFAGFHGLAQLGSFTVCGLLATATVIRWWLPNLINNDAARAIPNWVSRVQQAPRIAWAPLALILISSALLLISKQPVWNNELSGLTPVPQALQDLDADLRKELGAPDLRYLLAVRATDQQTALRRTEALNASLQKLVTDKVIGDYDSPITLLPSIATQQQRQQALPDQSALRNQLHAAIAGLPFREQAFEPFLKDIDASRTLMPLQPRDLANTPIADRLAALLFDTGKESVALITLSDVHNLAALQAWQQQAGSDVLLLDLKATSEQLVTRYRDHALRALGIALIVIALLMLAELRLRAALAVLLPVLATLLLEIAIFNWLGISLTLFHIVSLLLVGGLCFDYGLFFNRSDANDEESLRTRYAVMACWLSTTGSFGLLLISSLPVLRAIGSTVALGVTLGFVIALLARRNTEPATMV